MISKAEIKKIKSLHSKKGRELYNLILIEGKRLIEQVVNSQYNIDKVWMTEDFQNKNLNINKVLQNIDVNIISNNDIKKISSTKNSSGILGVIRMPISDIKKIKDKVIILDGISDPGNLGTILRTANWFGINDVVLSEECVDQYNTKVIRSAMGSHFSMNIVKTDILRYIKNLKSKDFQIVAAALDTKKSIGSLEIVSNKWALLMGSEAHGLSEKVSDLIDSKIRIPQFGIIDSLNVSVACGIFLYHMIELNN
mgnify:FL=1